MTSSSCVTPNMILNRLPVRLESCINCSITTTWIVNVVCCRLCMSLSTAITIISQLAKGQSMGCMRPRSLRRTGPNVLMGRVMIWQTVLGMRWRVAVLVCAGLAGRNAYCCVSHRTAYPSGDVPYLAIELLGLPELCCRRFLDARRSVEYQNQSRARR